MGDWEKELISALKDYTNDVAEGVKKAATDIGKATADKLKQSSPKRRGRYQTGWRSKNTSEKATETVVTVYNQTDYQLTHLLEHGHGGPHPARAYPHIAQAEAEATKEFEQQIRIAIQGGGADRAESRSIQPKAL